MPMTPFYRPFLEKPGEWLAVFTAILTFFTWIWHRMLKPVLMIRLNAARKHDEVMAGLTEIVSQFRPNGGNSFFDRLKSMEETIAVLELQQWCYFSTSSAEIGVFRTDATGRVTKISPAYTRWTGRSSEEWLDYGWQNAIHPDCLEYVVEAWGDAVKEKRRFEDVVTLRSPDGKRVEIQTDVVPISLKGELKGFFGVGHRKL